MCYAVYATELSPPDDERPIEWMLLTSLPVETLAQAQTIIGWYRAHWGIELYFHVLKSGCRAEFLRLESDERLEKTLAVYLSVAWRLHNLMMQARETPDAPAPKSMPTGMDADLPVEKKAATHYLWLR